MGIIDIITCEFPLPDIELYGTQNLIYQTKSLNPNSNIYTITKEGRLLWNTNIIRRSPEHVDIDMVYHGHIIFMTIYNDIAYTYKAIFKDGFVTEIFLI